MTAHDGTLPVTIVAEVTVEDRPLRYVLGSGSVDGTQHRSALYALHQVPNMLREIADYWDANLDSPQEKP